MGSACEPGIMFCDSLLYYTCSGNKVSLVISEGAGLQTDLLWEFYNDTCGGYLGMYCIVSALSK